MLNAYILELHDVQLNEKYILMEIALNYQKDCAMTG